MYYLTRLKFIWLKRWSCHTCHGVIWSVQIHAVYLYVPQSNVALFSSNNKTIFLCLLHNTDSLHLCAAPGSVYSDRLNEMNIQCKSSTHFLF